MSTNQNPTLKEVSRTVADMPHDPKKPKGLRVVLQGESAYQYARQISNSRFGHMPTGVAYCLDEEDVQYCVNYCRDNNIPFRIRSGGHQHEGMSSGNNVLVIALSEIYNREIIYEDELKYAWIPVGKQLKNVYAELGKKGKIIPGGGCESVNVGGLTHGGGWGNLIRKYGFTCDNIRAAEIVTADGNILVVNKDGVKKINGKDPENGNNEDTAILKKYKGLFRGLKGPGGGNFGIVTKFKFELQPKVTRKTRFRCMLRTDEKSSKRLIESWIRMQCDLDEVDVDSNLKLYASAGLRVLNSKEWEAEKNKETKQRKKTEHTKPTGLLAYVFGMYEGDEAGEKDIARNLAPILKTYFQDAELFKIEFNFNNKDWERLTDDYWKDISPIPGRGWRGLGHSPVDFDKGDDNQDEWENWGGKTSIERLLEETEGGHASNWESMFLFTDNADAIDDERFKTLPDSPVTTCDRPHPHKISSTFPKYELNFNDYDAKPNTKPNHIKAMVIAIYDNLKSQEKTMDVRKYINFMAMGGKVKDDPNNRFFAYHGKNYMMQVQCWWNEFGNPFVDEPRNEKYVGWVNEFRKSVLNNRYVEGAFINFVDKDLVENPNTPQGRLDLLKIYYGGNLDALRKLKTTVDPENLFNFPMSIPPV